MIPNQVAISKIRISSFNVKKTVIMDADASFFVGTQEWSETLSVCPAVNIADYNYWFKILKQKKNKM